MELKDFIKQTLIDIATAIKETNQDVSTDIIVNPKNMHGGSKDSSYAYLPDEDGLAKDNRPVQRIKFDIAVTSGGSIKGEAGAGINVVGLKIGSNGEVEDQHQNESRIQFEIPIALPNGKYR